MIKFSECSSLAWSYYKYIIIQEVDDKLFRLVSLVGKVPVYRTGGSRDRKSTRLNSSHANISYAVFCLKKKI